jgi:predicted nucleic acid-binding protein
VKTNNGKGLRKHEPAFAGGVTYRYVESSALVAAGLERDATAMQAIRGEGVRIASALTFAEARRTLAVARASGRLSPDQQRHGLTWLRRFERRCEVVDLSAVLLARLARPFLVEPVRSLDAIHLATIETIGDDPSTIAVVTRNRRIAKNARAMGYLVE